MSSWQGMDWCGLERILGGVGENLGGTWTDSIPLDVDVSLGKCNGPPPMEKKKRKGNLCGWW